ncbi:MAG: hypothetical protein L0Z73_19815 [Gammaproteobacteria bacterium]|nr:hypothetical protein [Gammaproteobacteria bacterium]
MKSPDKKKDNRGLYVAPSPFNAVKLELAVIMIVGLLLWIAVDSITINAAAQIVILMSFGVLGAFWLVIRTRYLLQRTLKK